MDKQSLLELLADNQLGELFDSLKNKQGYYKDLILLESQWNDLRTKQRNDLISNEQANLELGQIRNSLITLTIGLHFKGSINALLSSDKFRLIADELPGPMAPANNLSQFANARSYVEGDIKFELSDEIRRFTIVIEGKEDKKWNFSR